MVRGRSGALALLALLASPIACGARTGLRAERAPDDPVEPAASPDAGKDATKDATKDAPLDATDAFLEADAPGVKDDCTDPSVKYVYAVSNEAELFSLDPQDGAYLKIGDLSCSKTSTPFSMAVDRVGTAFVLYSDGHLYRVSTKTAKCETTSFVPGQLGFQQFGMGFATIDEGPDEELYVAATQEQGNQPGLSALGRIDTKGFVLAKVGDFKPPQKGAELTGTGDGRLFGFVADPGGPGTRIVQIDKKTAKIVAEEELPDVELGTGWAFAAWGGDFYLFTTPDGDPRVTRYEVKTGKTTVLAHLSSSIVGAGVSTCAPDD